MKTSLCTFLGAVGGAIAAALGGWDASIKTLVIFMAIDYVSGLIVAGVFHKSSKTPGGRLESRAGWKGLCRKGMVLAVVLVAARLDIVTGLTFIRDAVCIGYIANEAISILENAGLMGIPMPKVITRAVDLLTSASERAAEQIPAAAPEEDHAEQ